MAISKVLILLPSFAGGGAERTIVNLLKGFNNDSFQFKVILLSKEGPYLEHVDEKLLIYNSCNFFTTTVIYQFFHFIFKFYPFCIKTIKKEKPDVIISVTESMNYFSYFLKKKGILKNTKWILRCGNNIFSEAKSKLFPFNLLLTFLLKRSYRCADHIITINKTINNDLHIRFNIDPKKITTIYNPIDIQNIEKLCLNEPSITLPSKYILGVGRLAKQKRFDLLIKAFADSKIYQNEVHLIILGKGNQLSSLQKKAKSLKVNKFVHFYGFTQNPYVYMKNATAFVLTSDWEGFAHVVAEALVTKTPIIASNCKYGPSEILNYGEFGQIFKQGDQKELSVKIKSICSHHSQSENQPKLELKLEEFENSAIINSYKKLIFSITE